MKCKATVVVLSIVLASAFVLAMVMAPAPVQAASWTQVSSGGGIDGNFNQMQTIASSMAVYGPLLYIGTEEVTNGCEVWSHDSTTQAWTQVNTPGFGDPNNVRASSMAVYGGNLYVGTNNATGCEVWRYNGTSWSQVNADGFGSAQNTDILSMEVFTTGDGFLYAGTGNGAGCEVHQYNGTAWTPVAVGGFGNANNKTASSMADFQGDLYVGTGNSTTGCEVHYLTFPVPAWVELVGPTALPAPHVASGFGYATNTDCTSMREYTGVTGFLYFGTRNWTTGCHIHEFTGFAAPAWREIVGPASAIVPAVGAGFGNPANFEVSCMDVFLMGGGGFLGLYAATSNVGGCELWVWDLPTTTFWICWSGVGGLFPAGLFNSNNISIASMEPYGAAPNFLFLGTQNYIDPGCEMHVCDGLGFLSFPHYVPGFAPNNNEKASSMAVYGGETYVGTQSANGCQVWKYDGSSWIELVGPSGSGITASGFNIRQNWEAASMAVTGGKLYVGTRNPGGCEVYEYDGSNWTNVGTAGLGNPGNFTASAMAVHGGNLFVGTVNPATGCEVLKYTGPGTWKKVGSGGFDATDNLYVESLAEYGGQLYAGTYNLNTGTEVWRYDGAPLSWTKVGDKGFDGAGDNVGASSMAVFGGSLYTGIENSNTGAEVWRYDGNPLSWAKVGDKGLGKASNVDAPSLVTYDDGCGDKLYAGTWDITPPPAAGCEVYSYDGTPLSWTSEGTGGLGNTDNFAASSMVVNGADLYVGTYNQTSGCEVYRSSGQAAGSVWYLAEGTTAGDFETWVLVQNPGTSPVHVNFTLNTDTGVQAPGDLQGVEIPAESRRSFSLGNWVTTYDVSTKVECTDGTVVCERAVYWGNRIGGHDSVGYSP